MVGGGVEGGILANSCFHAALYIVCVYKYTQLHVHVCILSLHLSLNVQVLSKALTQALNYTQSQTQSHLRYGNF